MKNRYQTIKQIPLAIAVFIMAGTSAAQTGLIKNFPVYINKTFNKLIPIELDIPVVVVEHNEVTLLNKTYSLDVLAQGVFNTDQTLQITGDGILVTFKNTSGNIRPFVLGNIIYFGNDELEVLPTANDYRINTETYTLIKNVSYSFVDGVLTHIN